MQRMKVEKAIDQNQVKSGFISVIGRTNAGKSTMINALLGEDICFCSHKENATRRRMNVVVMHEGNQLIFIDTPGLHESNKSFNQLLLEAAKKSLNECDLILFVMSVFDEMAAYDDFLAMAPRVPHLVVINKFDLATPAQQLESLARFCERPNATVLPFSAKIASTREELLREICERLPLHPYYFEPDYSTDRPLKEVLRDLILEAVFSNLSDELPYKTEVVVTSVKTGHSARSSKQGRRKGDASEPEYFVHADIISDGRKAMIIGRGAATIKRISIAARKRIASYLGARVHLRLQARDKKGWQNDEKFLKQLKISE